MRVKSVFIFWEWTSSYGPYLVLVFSGHPSVLFAVVSLEVEYVPNVLRIPCVRLEKVRMK